MVERVGDNFFAGFGNGDWRVLWRWGGEDGLVPISAAEMGLYEYLDKFILGFCTRGRPLPSRNIFTRYLTGRCFSMFQKVLAANSACASISFWLTAFTLCRTSS